MTDPVNKSYLFTDKQLLAMPVRSITTSTSWTPQRKIRRISVADILERVGAKGETLTFYAERLLHRRAAVRRHEIQHDPGLRDGRGNAGAQKLRPAVPGYPRDAAGPELNSPLYKIHAVIWQVDRIVIKMKTTFKNGSRLAIPAIFAALF